MLVTRKPGSLPPNDRVHSLRSVPSLGKRPALSLVKVALLLGVFAAALIALPSAASAQGYAPTPTPTPTTPPGVSGTVVSTCTVQPSGGSCTATVNGCTITTTIPPGAFTIPTQILFSTGAAPTGVSGTVVCTFGISVVQNGSKITGTFSPAAALTVTSGSIAVGDELVRGSTVIATATAAGSVSSSFDSDPNFAVVAPAVTTAAPSAVSAVPSATAPVTGKPFALEELAASLLVGVGVLGLVVPRLRRRVRSN